MNREQDESVNIRILACEAQGGHDVRDLGYGGPIGCVKCGAQAWSSDPAADTLSQTLWRIWRRLPSHIHPKASDYDRVKWNPTTKEKHAR